MQILVCQLGSEPSALQYLFFIVVFIVAVAHVDINIRCVELIVRQYAYYRFLDLAAFIDGVFIRFRIIACCQIELKVLCQRTLGAIRHYRIPFAPSPVCQRFIAVVVDDVVNVGLRTNKEYSLHAHRLIICDGGHLMIHRVSHRSDKWIIFGNIDTLRMVEARHQLHIALGILHRHKGLVGYLKVSMVITFTTLGYIRSVIVKLIFSCYVYRTSVPIIISTTIVSHHAAIAQLGRCHVSGEIFTVTSILQLYVIRVESCLIFIGQLGCILR